MCINWVDRHNTYKLSYSKNIKAYYKKKSFTQNPLPLWPPTAPDPAVKSRHCLISLYKGIYYGSDCISNHHHCLLYSQGSISTLRQSGLKKVK